MAVVTQTPSENAVMKKTAHTGTFARVSRYVVVRLLVLFATVVIGVYLTIMIANMGGYVDRIMKTEIRDRITQNIEITRNAKMTRPHARNPLKRPLSGGAALAEYPDATVLSATSRTH
jgi:hypothetical protein